VTYVERKKPDADKNRIGALGIQNIFNFGDLLAIEFAITRSG